MSACARVTGSWLSPRPGAGEETGPRGPAETGGNQGLPRPDVVGQESAKRIVAVAVYNHYKRVFYPEWQQSVDLEKSNILLVGPTGTANIDCPDARAKLACPLHRRCDRPDEAVTSARRGEHPGANCSRPRNTIRAAPSGALSTSTKSTKIARRTPIRSDTRERVGRRVCSRDCSRSLRARLPCAADGRPQTPEQAFVKIDTSNILFQFAAAAFHGFEPIITAGIGRRQHGLSQQPGGSGRLTTSKCSLSRTRRLTELRTDSRVDRPMPVAAALDELDAADTDSHSQRSRATPLVLQYKTLSRWKASNW